MKKLLILLFVFVSFFANAQELDEIYIRDAFYLADSGVVAITEGDTLATIEKVRSTINDSLSVFVGSQWDDSTSGIVYAGGNVGIGTADPLSALHLNKGTGTGTGISFTDASNELYQSATGLTFKFGDLRSSNTSGWRILNEVVSATNPVYTVRTGDPDTGIGGSSIDNLSIIAGSKEIARASEATTEQFIINPQGDLTGTAAAPSLAFGLGANTGFYELANGSLVLSSNGTIVAIWNVNGIQSLDNIPTAPSIYNLGTAARIWASLWTEAINSLASLPITVNSVEALVINDAAAHSVAGIANYETLVTADDDIPNKAYVDSVAISVAGFLHGNYTENEVFDAMVVDIPDVNDAMIVSGAFDGAITTINASRAVKTAFDEVTVYGFTEAGAVATYVFDDGDATARDISLAW